MQNIFKPAIKIMNRLNYSGKFGLITVLFLLPIVISNYALFSKIQADIQITEREQKGVIILNQLLGLKDLSQDFRDYSVAYWVLQHSDDGSLKQETVEKGEVIKTMITAIEESLTTLPEGSDLLPTIEEMKQELNKSLDNPAHRVGDYTNMHEGFDSLNIIGKLNNRLIENTAIIAGLTVDSDPKVLKLINILTGKLPRIAESINRTRSYGTYGFNKKYLQGETFEIANQHIDALIDRERDITDIINAGFDHQGNAGGTLLQQSQAILNAIKSATSTFEEDVVLAEYLDTPWQEFYNNITPHIELTNNFFTTLSDTIAGKINTRLDARKEKRMIIFAGLAFLLAVIFYLYTGLFLSLRASVNQFVSSANEMSEGNMTTQVTIESQDEMSQLSYAFNDMVLKVKNLIVTVQESADLSSENAHVVSDTAQSGAKAADRQLHETEVVAAAIHQMGMNAKSVADNINRATELAANAFNAAESGNQIVQNSMAGFHKLAEEINGCSDAINDLSKQSDGISQILEVIKGIAAQTNLLALNAAIEAARAGEQGRGFAVVADEVRALASRTHESVVEIDEVIHSVQSGVHNAVGAMEISASLTKSTVNEATSVVDQLNEIVLAVENIHTTNGDISRASREQNLVMEAIEKNIARIADLATETSQGTKSTHHSADEMAELANQLKAVVQTFKVS